MLKEYCITYRIVLTLQMMASTSTKSAEDVLLQFKKDLEEFYKLVDRSTLL